jgi:hypothetical protein
MKHKSPLPRVDKKRRLVCVYSPHLGMFDLYSINKKGLVNKSVAHQWAFTDDVKDAFRKFTVPFAKFRAIPKVSVRKFRTWHSYVEGVWFAANNNDLG